ncbi:MAG: hypothetical protein AVDCRST_MAG89-5173, partial [uncultured Gemmatimonadetes bacterium]
EETAHQDRRTPAGHGRRGSPRRSGHAPRRGGTPFRPGARRGSRDPVQGHRLLRDARAEGPVQRAGPRPPRVALPAAEPPDGGPPGRAARRSHGARGPGAAQPPERGRAGHAGVQPRLAAPLRGSAPDRGRAGRRRAAAAVLPRAAGRGADGAGRLPGVRGHLRHAGEVAHHPGRGTPRGAPGGDARARGRGPEAAGHRCPRGSGPRRPFARAEGVVPPAAGRPGAARRTPAAGGAGVPRGAGGEPGRPPHPGRARAGGGRARPVGARPGAERALHRAGAGPGDPRGDERPGPGGGRHRAGRGICRRRRGGGGGGDRLAAPRVEPVPAGPRPPRRSHRGARRGRPARPARRVRPRPARLGPLPGGAAPRGPAGDGARDGGGGAGCHALLSLRDDRARPGQRRPRRAAAAARPGDQPRLPPAPRGERTRRPRLHPRV